MKRVGYQLYLGPYRLGARLATGGMGEVFLGYRTGLGAFEKPLAIKVLLPHLAEIPKCVEQFLHEARLAAQMSHPNIVQIFDVGEAEGHYFIAMELVRGVSLTALIRGLEKRGKKVSPSVVTYIGRCLCEALHHAHELTDAAGTRLGVVHRDVSPQNLLLSVNGEVKLTDFGIAKVHSASSSTRPGEIKGKYAYMSPEQTKGERLDGRSDLFSAGVTLFQLAAAINPFQKEERAQTLDAIQNERLPHLSALRPDFPPELNAAIEKATAADRESRFPDAIAFRNALPPLSADCREELANLLREVCAETVAKVDDLAEAHPETVGATAGERFGKKRVALLILGGASLIFALTWWNGHLTQPPAVAVPAPMSPQAQAQRIEPPAPLKPSIQTQTAAPIPVNVTELAPRRKAPPKLNGQLTVDATPWAQVKLDGKLIGETPLANISLSAGPHVLEFFNPVNQARTKRTVSIVSGQNLQVKEDLRP